MCEQYIQSFLSLCSQFRPSLLIPNNIKKIICGIQLNQTLQQEVKAKILLVLAWLTNSPALDNLISIIISFMKKKVEQKKEIVAIFQPGLYWEYQKQSQEAIDKVQAFLNNFANQLKALIIPEKTIQQNFETICQKIGYNVHPSLARKPKEQSQFPALKNHDYGEKYAIFLNHRIDAITLRLFGFLIQNFKLNSLKFSNNSLDAQVDEIKRIIERQEQLSTLYFEWNPIPDHPSRRQIFLSCVRPSLHHLILRQCHLGNQIAKDLIKKIKQIPDNRLKSLDLYGNELTHQIIDDISLLVEQSKNLEFLGLSKNAFSSEQSIGRLFNSIGEIPLSEQQYEQHKLKEKARDEVIQKNKKRKKGVPEEPVPFVFEVKDTANGKCYVKNVSLKILNLAKNGLKDSAIPVIRKFIENNGKNIELFIQGNKFSKTVKETLKFYENVIS